MPEIFFAFYSEPSLCTITKKFYARLCTVPFFLVHACKVGQIFVCTGPKNFALCTKKAWCRLGRNPTHCIYFILNCSSGRYLIGRSCFLFLSKISFKKFRIYHNSKFFNSTPSSIHIKKCQVIINGL